MFALVRLALHKKNYKMQEHPEYPTEKHMNGEILHCSQGTWCIVKDQDVLIHQLQLQFVNLPKCVEDHCSKSIRGYHELIDSVTLETTPSKELTRISGYEMSMLGLESSSPNIMLPIENKFVSNLCVTFNPRLMPLPKQFQVHTLQEFIVSRDVANIVVEYGEFGFLAYDYHTQLAVGKSDEKRNLFIKQPFLKFRHTRYCKVASEKTSIIPWEFHFPIKQVRVAFFDISETHIAPFDKMVVQINEFINRNDHSCETADDWRYIDPIMNGVVLPKYPTYIQTFQRNGAKYQSFFFSERPTCLKIEWNVDFVDKEFDVVLHVTCDGFLN